jgi:arginase
MIELIAVPFDGMGRDGAQANAPAALRGAGLMHAFGSRMASQIELEIPAASAHRFETSGLLNEAALVTMVTQTAVEVEQVLSRQHFPLVYGGDCSVLLATVPSLAAAAGSTGLLFLDGHEDATPMELSASGEAANMEIAILLGLTGRGLPATLGSAVGVLDPTRLAMLGPRDAAYREPLGVDSLADQVWVRTGNELAEDAGGVARRAAEHVASATSDWWLHVDLDVLSNGVFGSYGAPGEPVLPGGLTWPQLVVSVETLLQQPGCRGWSLGVYNPDLDDDGRDAHAIVDMITRVADSINTP